MMMDGPMPLLLFLHGLFLECTKGICLTFSPRAGAGDIGDDLDRLRNAEHVANLIDKVRSLC